MLVKVNNPTKEARETTALSGQVNAGLTSLPVLSTDGFSANDYIVIRKLGDEQAELKKLDSVSAGALNITSAVSQSHHTGAEIYVIPYNQVEISRKATKSSSYSVLTTIDLEPDSLQTVYDDTSGQDTNFYRVRFKNETTGQFSSYSADIKGTGASTSQAGVMINTVLRRTNDEKSQYTGRNIVLTDLNLAYQQVYNALINASSEFYLTSLEIPTEDYKHEYTLPENFKEIDVVRNAAGQIVPPTPRRDRYAAWGYELVGENTLYLTNVPEPDSDGTSAPTTVLINDAYDTDGTWAATLDAENVTTDNDEFKVGTGSINFDVDVSNDSGNEAVVTNSTMTAQDLSDFDETGKWRVWVYLPDVTYISSVTFRWGSDSSNYWSLTETKDYKNESLHDGWNLLEFNWGDATETGTVVPTAIDYLQLRIAYTANQPDDTDFRLDAIKIAARWNDNSVYEVMYLKQPAQVTNENSEFEIPEGYQYLLLDYAVAQILLRQGDNNTLAGKMLNDFEDHISKFITQSAKRTRRMIGFHLPHTRGYRRVGRSSSQIVHSDGNITKL